jgi:glutamate-1-semialdehyde aminotransferase
VNDLNRVRVSDGIADRDHEPHDIAPLGPVYQAGTLSGNPLAMAEFHRVPRLARRRLATVDDARDPRMTQQPENVSFRCR